MTDRMYDAAQRALDALTDLIRNTFDPGVEALGARYELAHVLSDPTLMAARDAARQAAGQPAAACGCGEPGTPGIVHRPAAPCYVDETAADPTTADDPVPLRWGLNDVLYGDDDTITVCLSGPDREPYRLELAPDQAAALRNDLADPDAPLSPYYSHEACGFHWHGRDGMDIPTRDGQPVCPRCELFRMAAEAQPAAGLAAPTNHDTEQRARARLAALIGYEPGEHDAKFEQHLDAYRAAILNSAADAAHAEGDRLYDDIGYKAADAAWKVSDLLRRLAAGAES